MQAYGGTDTLSDKLRRTRVVCTKPECTEGCAYALNCYHARYQWAFIGIWLALGVVLVGAVVAIV